MTQETLLNLKRVIINQEICNGTIIKLDHIAIGTVLSIPASLIAQWSSNTRGKSQINCKSVKLWCFTEYIG